MEQEVVRLFSGGESTMMSVTRTIVWNFKEKLKELSEVQGNWTPEYAAVLEAEHSKTSAWVLGDDYKQDQLDLTCELIKLIRPVVKDLSMFKMQVEVNFDDQPDLCAKILNTTGFTQYWGDAREAKQNAVIPMMTVFGGNVLKYEKGLVEKGIRIEKVQSIIKRGVAIQDIDTRQEQAKVKAPKVTEEMIIAMNKLYKQVIGICKIAQKFYWDDPKSRDMFTYSKIEENLGLKNSHNQEEVIETGAEAQG